jgi:oxygen-independent coproporphyrinogen-3 oxidase
MYKYAAGYLRSKGFEHYEVSSYARLAEKQKPSPWRSQHNQIYWDVNGQWYAFGLGSTSFINGVLTARPRTLADYIEWVQTKSSNATLEPTASDTDLLMDTILKRLRTSEGLSLDWIRQRFPQHKDDRITRAVMKGAQLGIDLGLASAEDDILILKDPSGFLYSNSIISSIFAEIENVKDLE